MPKIQIIGTVKVEVDAIVEVTQFEYASIQSSMFDNPKVIEGIIKKYGAMFQPTTFERSKNVEVNTVLDGDTSDILWCV